MDETTTIHESRLAGSPDAFKAPENHIFRKAYRQLSETEKATLDALKDKAYEVYNIIQAQPVEAGPSDKARALALAKTKLEESVMWAVKAITG